MIQGQRPTEGKKSTFHQGMLFSFGHQQRVVESIFSKSLLAVPVFNVALPIGAVKVRTIVASIAAFAGFAAVVLIGAAIALSLAYRHAVQNFQPAVPAGDAETELKRNP